MRSLRIGEADSRVVALDGDTKNSTYSDKFLQKIPGAFHRMFYCRTEHGGSRYRLRRPRQSSVCIDVRDVLCARV